MSNKEAKNYVIATGESHTVKEFVKLAFDEVGMDWKKYVKTDKKFFNETFIVFINK